jgi:hypothetical protein
MDNGHGERRALEGETFNELLELGREMTMIASVGTPFAAETG